MLANIEALPVDEVIYPDIGVIVTGQLFIFREPNE
jgi:hypothetical protein